METCWRSEAGDASGVSVAGEHVAVAAGHALISPVLFFPRDNETSGTAEQVSARVRAGGEE